MRLPVPASHILLLSHCGRNVYLSVMPEEAKPKRRHRREPISLSRRLPRLVFPWVAAKPTSSSSSGLRSRKKKARTVESIHPESVPPGIYDSSPSSHHQQQHDSPRVAAYAREDSEKEDSREESPEQSELDVCAAFMRPVLSLCVAC